MPQSGPRSGKHGLGLYGAGTVYQALRNWVLNHTSTPEDYVHSGTAGGHDRVGGVFDANGTFDQFGGTPVQFPGDTFTFIGFEGPDTGVYGQSGNALTLPSIVDSLTINWDWAPGGRLSMSTTFSANGCLDTETSSSYTNDDPSLYGCPTRMCDLSIWAQRVCDANGIGSQGSGSGETGGALTRLDNLASATLTFTADNQTVVNSSTYCCTERRPGNVDWTLAIVDQENYVQFQESDIYLFKLYVNATLFWELAWGIFTGVDNVNVNRETGEIISKTNNFAMKGLLCCGAGDTAPDMGYIKSPGAVTRWPIAATP